MKIETTTKLSHPTLILRGEFETNSAAGFLAAVDAQREAGNTKLMVSLRYVKYMNSTALGSIVRARNNCQSGGGDLVILQPSKLSRDIITKMGLESVLRIFDDEVEAAGYLGGETTAAQETTQQSTNGESAVSVMFSFDDARADLIPGKSHHGVAVLDSVDETTLTFRWNPEKHGTDASAAAAMFMPGSKMRNKLQLKMIRKEFFEADTTVEKLIAGDSGDVVVSARWAKLGAADREALARYHEDMSFLRKHTGESTGGDA